MINLKQQNKLNFIVSTCRSIRPPLYPPVKNVPALVMEGNQHTNKPKAMEDDDNTTETTELWEFVFQASHACSTMPT